MGGVGSLRYGLILLAMGGVVACGGDRDSLARVGGRHVELEAFENFVWKATGEAWQGVSARVASRLLDQFLDQQVVLESAEHSDRVRETIDRIGKPADVRMLLAVLCGPPPPPTAAAIEEEVSRRMKEPLPARAHVRQMLVDDLSQARAARKRLADGEDFVELSREVSRAPNAADGGEIGFVDQGGLPPEIDEVIFSLAAGEISDPVEGPSGYHVFQVLETVPAGRADRSHVKVAVRLENVRRAAREHTRECLDGLADEVGVEVRSERLWFTYDGRYAEVRNED
ncbi:MAG: peptidylprolyl isomerase [Thermoanaerobaculales bacterium]